MTAISVYLIAILLGVLVANPALFSLVVATLT